ncbi:MAG: threonine/serine exporter family protein [Lachnospiraceae bacterium]|nr:threonine/serine exporter family protein [Lachnospiraceae bacterium]
MIGQVIAAGLGTVAFALLFGVPRKYYVYCGLVGGAGWWLYSVLVVYVHFTLTEATFFATMLVVLMSRFLAVWDRCPATVFLTAGIFPLVPGAGIYWTAYYLVTDRPAEAADNGFAAIKAAVAIVLGIVLVFEVPGRFFKRFVTLICHKRGSGG